MPTTYEWVAEIVQGDEIEDSDYSADLPSLLAWGAGEVARIPGAALHVGVVRYALDAAGEEQDRDYAYAEGGLLAEAFAGTGKPVPARLRAAYARAARQ
jgi:hypothetical protein